VRSRSRHARSLSPRAKGIPRAEGKKADGGAFGRVAAYAAHPNVPVAFPSLPLAIAALVMIIAADQIIVVGGRWARR